MRVPEFAEKLGEALADHGPEGAVDALVMVKDVDTNLMFQVKGISAEVHEDGDGSTTLWINVEEM
jgi:hypothetical protein